MRLIFSLFVLISIGSVAYAFHKEHPSEYMKIATEKSVDTTTLQMSRGEMLYQNHCQVCHESNVHIREDHKAKSIKDILYWVTRWSTHLNLNWSVEDKQDVVEHLNDTYYKFPLSEN